MIASIMQDAGIISLEPLMRLEVQVGTAVDLGRIDGQGRRFIPITGGCVSGAVSGSVLAGGGDWQIVAADGTVDLRARYVLSLSGALVEVHSTGLRTGPPAVLARLDEGELVSPAEYYFRTHVRFRTAGAGLGYLNRLIAVGFGTRRPTSVELRVYRVP
jgi:Protein of unknown function (DUF3237)